MPIRIVRQLARTSVGTQDFTFAGLGTPKAAIFYASQAPAIDTTFHDISRCFGMTDGVNDRCFAGRYEDNVGTTDCANFGSVTKCIAVPDTNGNTIIADAEFSSWITDGIRINWTSASADSIYVTCILFAGDEFTDAYVGNMDTDSTGDYDVNYVGFRPDLVFVASSHALKTGWTNYGDFEVGISLRDPLSNWSAFVTDPGGRATSDVKGKFRNDAVGLFYEKALVKNYDAQGFTLEISVGRTYGSSFFFLCLKTDGNVNMKLDSANLRAATTGNKSYSGYGFQPNFLFMLPTVMASVPDSQDNTNRAGSIGIVTIDKDKSIFSDCFRHLHNATTSDTRSIVSDEIRMFSTANIQNVSAELASYDADGFTLDFLDNVDDDMQAVVLAINAIYPLDPIEPIGIASEESFGNVSIGLQVLPNSISSAEAIGIPSLIFEQFLSPDSILSEEAFGSISIDMSIRFAGAIASQEAWGSPLVIGGPVAVSPNGITSGEAFGEPSIIPGNVEIAPDSLPSGEAFGLLSIGIDIQVSGIASGEAFGEPSLEAESVQILSGSIPSGEAFGEPTIVPGTVYIAALGIASAELVASPTIVRGSVAISPEGINSGEAFGSPSLVPGTAIVNPTGIGSAEAFGEPSLTVGYVDVAPIGIQSQESFGTPYLTVSGVQVTPYSITSSEAFGSVSIAPGTVQVVPSSIASGESFGSPTVVPGGVEISPDGIASQESFGSVNIGLSIEVQAIVGGEAFGSPSLSVGGVEITPAGIVSEEKFGAPIVRHVLILDFAGVGIASAEAFGTPIVSVIVRNEFMTLMESDLEEGFFNMEEFAEQAVYEFKNGSTISLPVIFDHESFMVDPDTGAEIISRQPMIQAQTSDFSYHPDKGDKVTIRGVRYQIISHEPDGTGVSIFRLHHERTV